MKGDEGNLKRNLDIGRLLIYCKLFKKRMPIFISWALTHRCNSHCKYCDVPDFKTKELNTKQILKIVDEAYSLGNRVIVFTGGEPLLREDIGAIVNYCKKKGIYVALTTNGSLVKKRINDIKGIDMLQISFDGPKEIHDFQRGKGSYNKVMEAVRAAKEHGINQIVLNTTITNYNCKLLDDIIELAKKKNVRVDFEPVTFVPLGKKKVKPLLVPKEYRKELFTFLMKKKAETGIINNTLASLKYLRDYPNVEKIKCGAFRVNCVINPSGDIYPCTFLENTTKPFNCVKTGFREAFMSSKPVNCNSCLCNKTLDLSKLFSLDLTAIRDIITLSLK